MNKGKNETARLDIEIPWQTKKVVTDLAKKLKISRSELCSIWMGMIDPNNETLLNRSAQLFAQKEVAKLSRTRNALIAKLTQRGVLATIDQMSNQEIEAMINRIAKQRARKKK